MSWWDDVKEGDVLGDGPADKLKAAWFTLMDRRAERGVGLPTTDEALGSFVAAARAARLEPPFTRMVVWRERERVRDYDGSTGNLELEQIFTAAMEHIAHEYRQRFERPPRPSELFTTLEFILRPWPDAYLADATEKDWETLWLKPK